MKYPLRLSLLLVTAPVCAQGVVDVDLTAAPGIVDLGPGYSAEPAWLYGGQLPATVIRATVGDTLRVRLHNQLPETTILHFHGVPVRLGMDGMGGISRPEIAPGQEFLYELEDLHSGTYWFHPHSSEHHQLDSGLHGVLIVDPANPALDPAFDLEHTVVLDDWDPVITGGTFSGHLVNGRTSDGQTALSVQAGQQLRLRFVNVAARTNYTIALDGHPMTVTHADGNRVQPVTVDAIPIGIGERYDVLVDCNNPGVWSLAVASLLDRTTTLVRGVVRYAGQTGPDPSPTAVPPNLVTGALLDYGQLASYWPSAHPITAAPDRTYPVALGMQMGSGGPQWTINGEAWPVVTPMQVAHGEIVQLDLSTSTMGMNHLHPMHMHGHFVQLMGTAGGTTHPPLKDTVLIRPAGTPGAAWSAQFVADNPGSWLYHCHEMQHMARGMMTLIDYVGDYDADAIADAVDKEPTLDRPVLLISDQASAFQAGGAGAIEFQWQPSAAIGCFLSPVELPLPVAMPPYGDLYIDAGWLVFLGVVTVDPTGLASIAYVLPADPALAGLRVVLQGVGSTALAGGTRLSTAQAFTIR